LGRHGLFQEIVSFVRLVEISEHLRLSDLG
jgi:hypothetical protein